MAKYESSIKQIYYSQSSVFSKLADLSNLESIRNRFSDPNVQQKLIATGQVTADKIEELNQKLQEAQFTTDSLTISVGALGNFTIEIVEREPEKCVKYQSANSPIPVKLWIQVLPTSDTTSKMKVTIEAELNMFMKAMVGNKLKDGVDKFADMLAMIPYN